MSRRRSRVRVPSLPSLEVPANKYFCRHSRRGLSASWPKPVAQTSSAKRLQNDHFMGQVVFGHTNQARHHRLSVVTVECRKRSASSAVSVGVRQGNDASLGLAPTTRLRTSSRPFKALAAYTSPVTQRAERATRRARRFQRRQHVASPNPSANALTQRYSCEMKVALAAMLGAEGSD
jgi:hypothetical protein